MYEANVFMLYEQLETHLVCSVLDIVPDQRCPTGELHGI